MAQKNTEFPSPRRIITITRNSDTTQKNLKLNAIIDSLKKGDEKMIADFLGLPAVAIKQLLPELNLEISNMSEQKILEHILGHIFDNQNKMTGLRGQKKLNILKNLIAEAKTQVKAEAKADSVDNQKFDNSKKMPHRDAQTHHKDATDITETSNHQNSIDKRLHNHQQPHSEGTEKNNIIKDAGINDDSTISDWTKFTGTDGTFDYDGRDNGENIEQDIDSANALLAHWGYVDIRVTVSGELEGGTEEEQEEVICYLEAIEQASRLKENDDYHIVAARTESEIKRIRTERSNKNLN